MTNPTPQKAVNGRQAPMLFDAQNATGTLLLLTGSLALGLTAFWLTPKPASPQTAQGNAQGIATASAPVAGEQLASETFTYQDDDHEEEWDDDEGWSAAPAQQAQVQPGFSQQPMTAPRGWSRGS